MKVRKTRVKTKRVTCDNTNGSYYKWVSSVQVRVLFMWWTVSVIVDDDESYCNDRAREIENYLNAE